jgi:tartrate-resistant acid phosphatase type 5
VLSVLLTALLLLHTATYTLAAFAIGDWGTTVTKDSCCERSSTYDDYDVIAEDVVASIMDQQAASADVKPKVVISHGYVSDWSLSNGIRVD